MTNDDPGRGEPSSGASVPMRRVYLRLESASVRIVSLLRSDISPTFTQTLLHAVFGLSRKIFARRLFYRRIPNQTTNGMRIPTFGRPLGRLFIACPVFAAVRLLAGEPEGAGEFKPDIPAARFQVTDFGAVGDGKTVGRRGRSWRCFEGSGMRFAGCLRRMRRGEVEG
jgi:hypothetical protein